MRRTWAATAILVCFAGLAAGAYTYDSDTGAGSWQFNGQYGYAWSNIYTPAASFATPNDYEVSTLVSVDGETTLHGTVAQYLRASSTAAPLTGSYVSVQIDVGTSVLGVYELINGTYSQLGSVGLIGSNGILRSVIWGNTLWVFWNNGLVGGWTISLTTGYPGYGASYANASMSYAKVGHHDTAPPNQIAPNIATSVYASEVGISWLAPSDDASGVGVVYTSMNRDGVWLGFIEASNTTWIDKTATPGTQYTYSVYAYDFHGNYSALRNITVTTPAATSVDPRRPGVRSDGAYWGRRRTDRSAQRQPEFLASAAGRTGQSGLEGSIGPQL